MRIKVEQTSTHRLHKLVKSPHIKKKDRIELAVELLQRKFGNNGKSLRYQPPQSDN